MSRPEPKFSIGERVCIKAPPDRGHLSQPNALIVNREYQSDLLCMNAIGQTYVYTGWAYLIEGDKWMTDEVYLRPRPKPASKSLKEIMKELNLAHLHDTEPA